jgi:CRP-like cAMP-binding protein
MPKEEKKALRPTKAVQILRKFPFFQNLEEEEIQLLWDTLDRKEVPGGTTLVRAGDYAPGFYLLVHGSVELLTTMGRAIITLHEPGTLFGIAAYFSGETSAVSIRTTEACKLIIINGERFARALEANPALKEKALPLLARSLEGESAVIPAKTPYHTQVLEAKKRLL